MNAPCYVHASLNTDDYCKNNPTGGELAIVLEATETAPVKQTGKGQPVTIHLFCENPIASIGPILTGSAPGMVPSVSAPVHLARPEQQILEAFQIGRRIVD